MSVVVCAVPELPHLDPLLDGVRQWLAAEHIPHHNLPSVQALLGDPALMAQVQVAVGFGTMPMTAQVFDAAPRLHAVVSCVSGTDGFDVPAATARGILVANAATPDNQRGMAEAAVMLMLNLVHDLGRVMPCAWGCPGLTPWQRNPCGAKPSVWWAGGASAP